MCFMAFCGGVVYEATLCLTGFYNVYSYKAAEKTAQKKLEDEDFWVRVRARREAKQGLFNFDIIYIQLLV